MPTFLWPLLLLLTCSAPPARSPNVHTSVESPHTPAPGTSCLDHMWTQVKFSHDVPGMTPIQGTCGAQMPAVSVAATPPPCTRREPRGLQTESSCCSQDPVWGSLSAAFLFKFFLFELQK
ncbi:unnamed protein product [Rangifer tarandus platyrhynchus]|uniref:Uncharacterized protein n=1 Tax=Rangifer tarandus platyrhynchus TaxID=3082113 RepID=A0ABN8ZPW0_RANTA|nr:unnamed protein product [Rangifer tarandus platyrhynchus]